jgi:hypothetical protein
MAHIETITPEEVAALETLEQMMRQQPQQAWESHCGLADDLRATGMDPKVAHQAAAVAMRYVFRVDITAMQEYQDIMGVWR